MEFLKEILGDDLFAHVAEKINAHNGNEANKDKQIKVGNLATGEYTSTAKYKSLEDMLTGKQTELDTANNLIKELEKGTKGNEELQGKIKAYDTQVADLQKQLQETKVNAALKVAFLEAKALDIDYLTYKVQEKMRAEGKTLELDENEHIKGWDDLLNGLKTELPKQFEAAKGRIVDPIPLPDGGHNEPKPQNLADALRMQYESK